MLSMGSSSGNVVKNLNEYMCDSAEDVKDLPVDIAPGSTAIVIATAQVFMLNNQKEWIEL